MKKELFIAATIDVTEDLKFHLLFEKDMNLRELIECYIQIEISLDQGRKFKKVEKVRYVVKDQIIPFDQFLSAARKLIDLTIKAIDALNSGINLLPEFYLEVPGLDNTPVEVRKSLKKLLNNLDDFKLQPFIMQLYIILTSYKGTDTLQQRKYKKMIETQEYIMNLSQRGQS